jgi:hypothetical protein
VWHATGKLCYLVDLPVMKCDPPVWDLIIWTFINYKSVGLGFSRVHLLEWLYLFLYNISSANWLSCTKTIFFSCIYCISCGLFWSFSSLTAGVRWCGVGWMVSLCLVPSKHVGLSDQEEMLWTGWCWHEKCTQRQSHSKPNKAGFTRVESKRRASQFFLKINKR